MSDDPIAMRFDHAPLTSGPRGPWAPHPFLGAGHFFADPVTASLRLRELGDVVPVSGHSPAVLVGFGPDVAREALTNQDVWARPSGGLIGPPPGSAKMGALMRSMILMHGPSHRARRRIMVPPMHQANALAAYGRVMAATTQEQIVAWEPGDVLDMAQQLTEIALLNQIRCLLGVESPTAAARLAGRVARVSDALLSPATGATQWLARKLRGGAPIPGTPYAAWVREGEGLYDELLAVVRARRASGTGRDVLSTLIEALDPETGATLTDDELVGEVMALYSAGYETTARAMLWTVLLLATHPRVAEGVAAEAREALRGRAVTPAELRAGALPQLTDAVLEALRLLPPAAITIPRVSTRETELGALRLPAGATLLLSPVVEHRDPATFARPLAFAPERWQELSPAKLPHQYIPFGAGPRRCIGEMIAQTQIRVVLSLLVQRWAFELTEPRVDFRTTQIVMGPAGPVHMRVTNRPLQWAQSRLGRQSTLHKLVDLPVA